MAWNQYLSSSILLAIRERANIPTSTVTLNDASLLRMIDEELQGYLVPFVKRQREGYFQTSRDITLSVGVSKYRLPERAVAGSIVRAWYVDGNGCEIPLALIASHQVSEWRSSAVQTGQPAAHYFEGSKVCLVPAPNTAATLRIEYELMPSQMVLPTAVSAVTAINGNQVTLTGPLPASFVSGTSFDFVQGNPGFDCLGIDKTATVSGSVLTFTAGSVPSDLAVGDYVTLAGQSPFPQIPASLQLMLQHRVIITALQSLGDNDSLREARNELVEIEKVANTLLAPRSTGSAQKITGGILGSRSTLRNFWRP